MKHINLIKSIAILLLILSSYYAESQIDTTITKIAYHSVNTRSINVSSTICLGKEIGFNGSLEYENYKWGKLILRPQISSMQSQESVFNGILLDFGVGYGYPLFKKNRHALYANVYMTYFLCGTKSVVDGPSIIVEFEYRLKLKHNYLIIAPYYRGAYINNVTLRSENKSDFTYGLRIGIAHDFELKN